MATFGPYELIERIGSGGMGEVLLALLRRENSFEKRLVIKRILPSLSKDPQFAARFHREARIAALLNHQNIVQVYDYGRVEDEAFIAMEYVDGADLRSLLTALGSPDQPAICAILTGMARGLDYVHRLRDPQGRPLRLVHRDISPGNVLLSREGEVKLTDFGLVTAKHPELETDTGGLKGKVAYMSPEQTHGDPVDPRCDLFSWGVVAYELLVGERPFTGSILDILTAIRKAHYSPIENPDIPASIVELIHRCLRVQPQDRPETAAELLSTLERASLRAGWTDGVQQLAQWVTGGLAETRRHHFDQDGTVPDDQPLNRPDVVHTIPAKHRLLVASQITLEPSVGAQDDFEASKLGDLAGQPPRAALPGEGAADESGAAQGEVSETGVSEATGSEKKRPYYRIWAPMIALVLVGVALLWSPPWKTGQDIDTTAPTPSPNFQTVRLSTHPEGARISVDQEFLGISPVDMTHVEGDCQLQISAELAGYERLERAVAVADLPFLDGEHTRYIRLSLTPRVSLLSIESTPAGIEVLLDQVVMGETPVEFAVDKLGEHRVSLELPGYRSIEETLWIDPGVRIERHYEMVPLHTIQFRIQPEQAQIDVEFQDGEFVTCEVPCSFQTVSQSITVRASHHGYRSHESVHDIERDTLIDLALAPLQQRIQASWRSRDLEIEGQRNWEVGAEPIRRTIQFQSPDGGFAGTIAIETWWEESTEVVHANLAIRSRPWSMVMLDERTEQGTPLEQTGLQFAPGIHDLSLRREGTSSPLSIQLVVRVLEE